MPDFLDPEVSPEEEPLELVQTPPSTLAILAQSEHAAMVTTANLRENRRRLAEFDSKLMAYANHSPSVAILMFYSMPRAGKQIIGASIRFAEIVAPCWKNCAVAARVIGESESMVTSQGVFHDYESNVKNLIEVPRRIVDKEGRRYSADMIVTTANAAMSVARRNAVLKGGVPQALWTPAYEAAQLTAVGKAISHEQRVASALDYLFKLGVTEWQILNSVGATSPRDLETEHLVTLRVLCEEIRRKEKSIEEVFGSPFDKEIAALSAQLKLNQAQQEQNRRSYMGRAQELVEYLRARAGKGQTQGKPVEVPKPSQPAPSAPTAESEPSDEVGETNGRDQEPANATTQESEGKPHATRGRGRPTREEMAARRAAEEAANTATQGPETEAQDSTDRQPFAF